MIINKITVILCFALCTQSAKLNVPTVLLPLFTNFSPNFTLEVTEGGCYTWSSLRLNIVRLQCLDADPELGCCSRVVVSSGIKELRRNTDTVLAEEVHSGEVLRCEVILDVIHNLHIVTTTREILLDESPETFEVRASDDQGNEFSTLEGVEFDWTFRSVGAGVSATSNKTTSESTVVRYIPFGETTYETPRSIGPLEKAGLKGHTILLEGRQTGAAAVAVRLPQPEYAHLGTAGVQLLVVTNLIVTPKDATIMVHDNLKYRLQQCQQRQMNDIAFPSAQYHLKSEKGCVEVDPDTGIATGLQLGRAQLVLVDSNVGSSPDVKPATAYLTVAKPHELMLDVLPHRKWSVVVGQKYDIVTELFDSDRRIFQIGNAAVFDIRLDQSYFRVDARPKNGSYVHGVPLRTGRTEVVGELKGVRLLSGMIQPLASLTSVAELYIYNAIRVQPESIVLPWDPITRARYDIQLTATGGDGAYTWSSLRSNVAVVTQRGVVKTLEQGVTNITAKMTSNPAIQGQSVVRVVPPVSLEILDTQLDAEIGRPISVFVAMYADIDGQLVPFTRCEAFPLQINFSEDNFELIANEASADGSCAVIKVVGHSAGTSQITISYGNFSDSAILAAYTPLMPIHPVSGASLLAVGTSRLIVFSGGPRSWAMKPSEQYHSLHNPDFDGDKIAVDEVVLRKQKHVYAFRVSCRQLSETTLTLQVVNTIVGSNSKPATASASVVVTCGKPKFLLLKPALQNLPKCPLHAEEIVALHNRDLELEVVVRDSQGRQFDNITSLELVWTFSKPAAVVRQTLQPVNVQEDGFEFPGSFVQRITALGRSGVVDVHAKVVGYDQEIMFGQSLTPESPAFPEVSVTGEWRTPDIHASLSIQTVEGIQLSSNATEIFAGGNDVREIRVIHGSGHFEIGVNISGVVDVRRAQNSLYLSATSVGNVLISVKDDCLDTEPAHLAVQVYRIGAISLDVMQFIEKGKSDRARAVLYDHEGLHLKSIVDPKALKLKPVPGSEHISIGPDTVPQPGEIIFTVRGVDIGQSSLSVVAADVSSPTVSIQVFPPLRLHPRNITLLVGASLQLSALDGPPGALLEWSVEDTLTARVASDGVVNGLRIGTSTVTVRAITVRKHTGQREVSSQDRVEVRVVPLKGVAIHAPIIKIVSGARMPLRAAASAAGIGALHLSLTPPLHFTWSLSQDSVAQIQSPLRVLGLNIADVDLAGVHFHALKPGRVTVTLLVQVPGVVAGLSHSVEYTDSISIQILPDIGLSSPRPMQLEHLLVSTQASTELRTTRDVRRYNVTNLSGGPDVLRVSQDGVLTAGDNVGAAIVAFGHAEKPWRHLIVYVKRVEYMMVNAVPHWRLRDHDPVAVLPNGLDLTLSVSFHDDEGNQFDAVRSNIMVQPQHKGLVSVTRGAENGSFTLNILESGSTSVKVWDNRAAHKPADFLHIRSGDVLFPTNIRISVGDVVCLRMPVVTNEDSAGAWTVDDPAKLRLWPELGIAVACASKGNAVIAHRASPRLRSLVEVLPLHRIELLPHDSLLTTAPDAVVDYPLLLSAASEVDKRTNLVARNRTCGPYTGADFAPSCYPFSCHIYFNNPAATLDIDHIFHAAPAFSLETGLYSCRVESISKPSPSTATLSETIVLTAVSVDGSIQSRSALLPFSPALYLHQTHLKFTYTKPSQVFTVSGLPDVFNQVKIVTDKHLVSVSLTKQLETMRTYMVTVDQTWWTLDEPPPLNVVLWSPKTQQKLVVQLRCAGPRLSADDSNSYLPWLVAVVALLVAVAAIMWPSRLGTKAPLNTTESAFMTGTSPSPAPNQTMLSHIHNSSGSSWDCSPRRPLEDYPVYGSPWRRRVNN